MSGAELDRREAIGSIATDLADQRVGDDVANFAEGDVLAKVIYLMC